jgi:hypothetical protein
MQKSDGVYASARRRHFLLAKNRLLASRLYGTVPHMERVTLDIGGRRVYLTLSEAHARLMQIKKGTEQDTIVLPAPRSNAEDGETAQERR